MAAARIAIIAFFFSLTLKAQSPSRIELKVKDPSGGPIPHARVQALTLESKITSKAETDAQGEAILCLGPDTSTISVRAFGFDGWQYKIDMTKAADRPLIAVLRIQSYYGPTLVNPDSVPVLDTKPLIAASIPLEPLAILTALPRHNLRRYGWIHLN